MKAKTRKGVSIMVIFCVLFGIYQSFRLTNIMLKKMAEPTVIVTTNQLIGGMPNIIEEEEEKEEIKEEPVIKEVAQQETKQPVTNTVVSSSNQYRLTSFYSNDGYGTGSCTGSGLCEKDFQVNERGWYTYNGYLVLAGATEELLRSGYSVKGGNVRQEGKHYFRYYDVITLTIDGISYQGIILDSCGASMWYGETRLDLFVSNKASAIDRGYKGNNMVSVSY